MSSDNEWPYFLHGGPADGMEVRWIRATPGMIYCVPVMPKLLPTSVYHNSPIATETSIRVATYIVTGPGRMDYIMTTPPTPEAVEAAIMYGKGYWIYQDIKPLYRTRTDSFEDVANNACGILAAEVERLRADLERAEQKNEADRIARDHIISKGVALEKELAALKTDIRMAQEGTK